MSHTWTSRVAHLKESWHTYEEFMPHIRRSHVTHMEELRHTHERVKSHRAGSSYGVAPVKESCLVYEGVMSHVWRRHVTHMKESCHIYEGVMACMWKSHVTASRNSYVVPPIMESCHTYEGKDWQAPYIGRSGLSLPCNSWQCSVLTHTLSHAFCANVFLRWCLFSKKKALFWYSIFKHKLMQMIELIWNGTWWMVSWWCYRIMIC